jgi:hypothetical protein
MARLIPVVLLITTILSVTYFVALQTEIRRASRLGVGLPDEDVSTLFRFFMCLVAPYILVFTVAVQFAKEYPFVSYGVATLLAFEYEFGCGARLGAKAKGLAGLLRSAVAWAWDWAVVYFLPLSIRVGKVQRKAHKELSDPQVLSDERGYYIQAGCSEGTYRVYLDEMSKAVVLPVNNGINENLESLLEMRVPGAVVIPLGTETSRAGNVSFRVGGEVFGMGARIIVSGKGSDFLSTVMHTVTKAWRYGVVELEHKGRVVEVDFRSLINDHEPLLMSKTLDVAVLRVPPKVWSLLGVKALPVAPASRSQCEAYGYEQKTGNYCSTTLALTGTNRFCTYTHLGGTENGWSGTPIICKGRVVAVHVRRKITKDGNIAVELWPLLQRYCCLESETPEARYKELAEEFEGPEDYAVDVAYDDGFHKIRVKGKQYIRQLKSENRAWADFLDDEELGDVPFWSDYHETRDIPNVAQTVAEAGFPGQSVPPQAADLKEAEEAANIALAEVEDSKAKAENPIQAQLKVEVGQEAPSSQTDAQSPHPAMQADPKTSEQAMLDVMRKKTATLENEINAQGKTLARILSLLEPKSAATSSAAGEGKVPLETSSGAMSGPSQSNLEQGQECPSPSSDSQASPSRTAAKRKKSRSKPSKGNASIPVDSESGTGQPEALKPKESVSPSKPADSEPLPLPPKKRESEFSEKSLRDILDRMSQEDLQRIPHWLEEARMKKSKTVST